MHIFIQVLKNCIVYISFVIWQWEDMILHTIQIAINHILQVSDDYTQWSTVHPPFRFHVNSKTVFFFDSWNRLPMLLACLVGRSISLHVHSYNNLLQFSLAKNNMGKGVDKTSLFEQIERQ